ncbi:MAG: MotA/TolQ/ExbB proton channel family protein [Gemmataceae bacterium]
MKKIGAARRPSPAPPVQVGLSMAFPASSRPTREWPLLVLALALVCAICIPLWQYHRASLSEQATTIHWTADRLARLFLGPEQIACYCAFAWASFILLGRYLEVRRQRGAFALELLPPGQCILVDDARDLQRRIEDRVGHRGPYILANMLRLALGKFATSRSSRDVAHLVNSQAEVDLGRLVSSMATVHYLAWAIPAIGFLGTVRGLAGSLTLGGRTKEDLATFVEQATGHLNVAFDCTLVALALSLVVMFLLHAVQREEEGLVIDCQQYCLEHLVSRLYEAEPEAPEAVGLPGDLVSTLPRAPEKGRYLP